MAKRSRGRPQITAEKRAAIIAALQANPNTAQVARQIDGISRTTVWHIAKVAGIALAARASPITEKRAAMIAALQANPNARQVARQMGGVSHETVRHIAQAADIALARARVRRIATAGGPQTPANTFVTHDVPCWYDKRRYQRPDTVSDILVLAFFRFARFDGLCGVCALQHLHAGLFIATNDHTALRKEAQGVQV